MVSYFPHHVTRSQKVTDNRGAVPPAAGGARARKYLILHNPPVLPFSRDFSQMRARPR